MKKHVFITSIGPGTNTLEAIRSWTRIPSVEVHSINISSEIDVLSKNPVFSKVIFHEVPVTQTGMQRVGKPYVNFNSVISYGLKFAPRKVILLNSDIILNPTLSVEKIEQELDRLQSSHYNLIYMHRNDFDGNNYNQLSYYTCGIDIFVMSQTLLQSFPSSQFMIGQPWFDYFIPHWAIKNNISTSSFNTRSWLHRRHQSAWKSNGLYESLKSEFYRFIKDLYVSQPVSLGDHVQASEIFMQRQQPQKSIKSIRSLRSASVLSGRSSPVRMNRSHSAVISKRTTIRNTVRNIVRNPVRAKQPQRKRISTAVNRTRPRPGTRRLAGRANITAKRRVLLSRK